MKKLALILIAISVTSLGGCQNLGSSYKNLVLNADANMAQSRMKALQNPKTVQKCWDKLNQFQKIVQRKPQLANFNANRLESTLRPTRSIWGPDLNNDPCLALPNYMPAAYQAIAQARQIGNNPQQLRGYQNYRGY